MRSGWVRERQQQRWMVVVGATIIDPRFGGGCCCGCIVAIGNMQKDMLYSASIDSHVSVIPGVILLSTHHGQVITVVIVV